MIWGEKKKWSKIGIEGNFFNLKKSLADIILNGKMLNAFLLSGNKAKMSTLSTLIQNCTEVLASALRQRKGSNTLYCSPRENYSMIFISNIFVGLFLGPLFCSIDLVFFLSFFFFFLPIPHCLNYYSFIVSLKVRWCLFSSFLLLQYCVGSSGPLASPYKLYSLFISTVWDFGREELTSWYWIFLSMNIEYLSNYLFCWF